MSKSLKINSAEFLLLKAENLGRKFGRLSAISGLNIEINKGDKVLILGPNGSGKSTLLRLLVGRLRASAGSVSLVRNKTISFLRENSTYLGAEFQLYAPLTVRENLEIFSSVLGEKFDVSELISRWGLDRYANNFVETLSRGTQSKLALARVLESDSLVLALDEPTIALDASGRASLIKMLSLRNDKAGAFIVASHETTGFAAVINRVLLMKEGAVVSDVRGEFSEEQLGNFYQRACL